MAGSDFSNLQAAIDSLTSQVASTETVEASAAALITGFSQQIDAAVAAALAADDAADQGSITAAQGAIAEVTARFQASAANLGNAIPAGTTTTPATAAAALKRR